MQNPYKPISPQSLTRSISFQRDNIYWQYDSNERSTMPDKQAEGSARLFNLLIEHGVALLADEVGMGKTIQALSVIASLWQQKPNARVLVLAPRMEIARNWISEYETFINVHYKLNDDVVKNKYGNKAMHAAHYCENLYHLVEQYNEIGKRFFVGKISSFSSLFSGDTKNRLNGIGLHLDDPEEYEKSSADGANKIGNLLREKLIEDKENAFDLVIIDEAHYFRNIEGGSLKVNAAKGFFGIEDKPLSNQYLLLTATPNHSSSSNIPAIFSYFKKEDPALSSQELLNKYAVRRFRRLSSKGFMKYNYRHEQPVVASFDDDPMSEIFFGLYQKKLAMDYLKETDKQKKNRMLNFLEGTEFIPRPGKVSEEQENKEDNQRHSGDYYKGMDSDMLTKLSLEYKEQFDRYPQHPKYDVLINSLTKGLINHIKLNEKNLVFVRRIPSVKEIAGRVNLEYDKVLWGKIMQVFRANNYSHLPLNDLTRSSYEAYFKDIERAGGNTAEDEDDEIEEQNTNEENPTDKPEEGFLGSKVLDLFKILKKTSEADNVPRTHASNFRLRFSKSKPGIFPMFFAPGADYNGSAYVNMNIIEQSYSSSKKDSNFYVSAIEHRLKTINKKDKHRLRAILGLKEDSDKKVKNEKQPDVNLDTLLTIFWNYLSGDDKLSQQYDKCKQIYSDFSVYEKEAFSNFLEKGIILASGAIVDLYAIFIEVQLNSKTKDRIEFYKEYTQVLKDKFDSTALPQLIISSLDRFKLICEKVFNLQSNDSLVQYEWKNFFNQDPAYPYWGATKNQRVIASFNTPFFPDVLISTSVLQEGVNLQYYCNNIIHYGIAWTPGDNEQRVGRVDRMFGKIEKKLEEDNKACLNIAYPYLKHTIDQDHVANFIYKKYSEENRIDRCSNSEGDKKLNYQDLNTENWNNYFRKPIDEKEVMDPYGVDLECFKEVKVDSINYSEPFSIKKAILETLFDDEELEVYETSHSDFTSKEVCVAFGKIKTESGKDRGQPIFIEMEHCPIVSDLCGESVYVLVLKTPLGNKKDSDHYLSKYNQYCKKYENTYVSAKLCIDESQPAKSNFYVYMKIEIPLLSDSDFKELSSDEILVNVKDLIQWADSIELDVFGEKKDLSLSDVDKTVTQVNQSNGTNVLRDGIGSIEISDQWEIIGKFRRITSSFNSIKEDESNSWRRNHEMNFIKNYSNSKDLFMQVAYLDCDMQKKEQEVLEKTFEYFKNKILSSLKSGNFI